MRQLIYLFLTRLISAVTRLRLHYASDFSEDLWELAKRDLKIRKVCLEILENSELIFWIKGPKPQFIMYYLTNRYLSRFIPHLKRQEYIFHDDYAVHEKEYADAYRANDLETERRKKPIKKIEPDPTGNREHLFVRKGSFKASDGKRYTWGFSEDVSEVFKAFAESTVPMDEVQQMLEDAYRGR